MVPTLIESLSQTLPIFRYACESVPRPCSGTPVAPLSGWPNLRADEARIMPLDLAGPQGCCTVEVHLKSKALKHKRSGKHLIEITQAEGILLPPLW